LDLLFFKIAIYALSILGIVNLINKLLKKNSLDKPQLLVEHREIITIQHPELKLMGVQLSIMVLVLLFIAQTVYQSQMNIRLYSISQDVASQLIQVNAYGIFFFPFLLYLLLGLFYKQAYLTRHTAALPNMLFEKPKKHPKLFIFNWALVVNDYALYCALILCMTLGMLLLFEGFNQILSLSSWFKYPACSTFTVMLITQFAFVIVKRFAKRHIKKTNYSLGIILFIFVLLFGFIFLFLNPKVGQWIPRFISANEELGKSPIAGNYASKDFTIRFALLLYGFPLLLLPCVATIMGRFALMFSNAKMILVSVIVPALMLLVFKLEWGRLFFTMIYNDLQKGAFNILAGLFCLTITAYAFLPAKSVSRLARLWMPKGAGSWKHGKLYMVVPSVCMSFSTYLAGIFLLGLAVEQLIITAITINIIFMLVVIFIKNLRFKNC